MAFQRLLGVGLIAFALASCEGSVIRPGGADTGPRDQRPPPRWDRGFPPPQDTGPPPPDLAIGSDLPSTPLDPCLTGKCGNGMLCIANICHATCDQQDVNCNDKVATCGPNTACRPASSFSDACYPASPIGTACGSGVICEGGSLCVNLGNGQVKCLRLCKYGCAAGKCATTQKTKCQVCVE